VLEGIMAAMVGCYIYRLGLGLHQGKNVKVIMEFEIPKRHILRPTLSTNMVQRVLWWERQKRYYGRKRQGPMAEKCYYDILS
jgi:hypothetical protein